MNRIITFFVLVFSFFFISCSDDNEEIKSVTGIWNATKLTEIAVYSDLNKEEQNSNDVNYGSYVWELKEDGKAKIT